MRLVVRAKAELLYQSKLILNSGLVEEIVFWRVSESKDYQEGIKYRLVLVDPVWKKILVLFDNHSPTGDHGHNSVGKEYNYHYISVELLIEDFFKLRDVEEKKYENNEN